MLVFVNRHKKSAINLLLVVLILFNAAQVYVSAISKPRLESLINDRPFYDSSAVLKTCSSGGSKQPTETA